MDDSQEDDDEGIIVGLRSLFHDSFSLTQFRKCILHHWRHDRARHLYQTLSIPNVGESMTTICLGLMMMITVGLCRRCLPEPERDTFVACSLANLTIDRCGEFKIQEEDETEDFCRRICGPITKKL